MEENKLDELHWRDVQQSDYLASWDFQKDKETLTIKEVKNEVASLGYRINKVIAYFHEDKLSCGTLVKPMILNNTNLKFIQEKTGLRHQKLWNDVQVEISVMDNNSKIGGKKKLVITKAAQIKPFDINALLALTDYAKAKEMATQNSGRMSPEDIEKIKNHLETIKNQK